MANPGEGRWRPTLGALQSPESTTFRVWAPRPREVALVIRSAGADRPIALEDAGEGYRQATLPRLEPGETYGYTLDGAGPFPDPCSRRQPAGVHGLSAVVDPAAFRWSDQDWVRPALRDLVIYECHIGTLTNEGTFDAATGILPGLAGLGVSAVELMPVASFPGRWNWGYDGVSLYAPAEVYGGPDGLRRFVDAAHGLGLAVILDVVYNHFGPAGNYSGLYSNDYVTNRYSAPWGQAINFDGPASTHTRRFFRENLLHWLHEYHIDGFRFDATHTIFDASPVHILAELAEAAREAAGSRPRPYLIAETHENDKRYMTAPRRGGFGFDAVWADDFHHAVRTALLAEDEGYLRGFDGTLRTLGKTIRQGFLYEGQFDAGFGGERGTPARRSAWSSFVYCIQNHDQVGNRAFGERLNIAASQGDFLAATVLLLLLPQVPLLFQGQEFLSSRPFLYFTDHEGDLGRAVTEGRRREFAAFGAFSDRRTQAAIPDPQSELTFARSVLDHDEASYGPGRLARELCQKALELRRNDPVFSAYRQERLPIGARARGRCLLLAFEGRAGRRWIAVNFGDRATVDVQAGPNASIVLYSNDGRFGGNGVSPRYADGRLTVPAHAAVVLRA